MYKGTNPVLIAVRDGWDSGDPFGSAMGALGAIADVLEATGGIDLLDPGCGYSRGMAPPDTLDYLCEKKNQQDSFVSFDAWVLATDRRDGRITDADLAKASRILHLYIEACDRAGRSY